ncbi:hypothetical protein MFLAVUS_006811 [Mucor flavus]|uniref:Uncharacterized protein n=1 Tax=Mucor flavus TaxID=439312 RepID=A0ABP9Z2K0_9FUNG
MEHKRPNLKCSKATYFKVAVTSTGIFTKGKFSIITTDDSLSNNFVEPMKLGESSKSSDFTVKYLSSFVGKSSSSTVKLNFSTGESGSSKPNPSAASSSHIIKAVETTVQNIWKPEYIQPLK